MSYLRMNLPGAQRKSYVIRTTFSSHVQWRKCTYYNIAQPVEFCVSFTLVSNLFAALYKPKINNKKALTKVNSQWTLWYHIFLQIFSPEFYFASTSLQIMQCSWKQRSACWLSVWTSYWFNRLCHQVFKLHLIKQHLKLCVKTKPFICSHTHPTPPPPTHPNVTK